ncbi:S-adenosyl-L-methionine-dependent methyltransferase [Cladorrhinum sp. PSN332]|nr:S-adenosyl-L-methionine-dependent methyltransferase [Cladorrhinum sp. PSN332]
MRFIGTIPSRIFFPLSATGRPLLARCNSQSQARNYSQRQRFRMTNEAAPAVDSYKLQQPPPQQNKRPFQNGGQKNRKPQKRGRKAKPAGDGSPDEVLQFDIQELIAKSEGLAVEEQAPLPEQGSIIDVEVVELSSTGDGLAKLKGSDHIYVVPFGIPGDTVKIKVYRHNLDKGYSAGDFISVVSPSPLRDDGRIQCKYFSTCSGCQFQMLDYAEQLRRKRDVVVKAYKNFSDLEPGSVPEVLETIGSPLQYGYRTKLTPHFDGPPGNMRRGPKKPWDVVPPIGFTPKASRQVLDIEDCPIATEAVRKGLADERRRMEKEFGNYTKGATILLRESTKRVEKPLPEDEGYVPPVGTAVEGEKHVDYKTCITDNNATSTEYIDDFVFTNPAGSFFQNNNSILPPFTQYIREHVLPRADGDPTKKQIRNLIDAYSGSGLFTITQSALFPGGSIGIDIADKSIDYARRNATLNGLKEEQCRFIAADAPELFKSVEVYDPDETVVILDPPRKGCDGSFLRQLLRFAPRRVVYVSCNVHTQARDVGVLVRGEVEGLADRKVRYEIESIRGFDFFPQTGHVEGVAVLNRVDEV